MRFSVASVVTLGMVSLAMALPYDASATNGNINSVAIAETGDIANPAENDALVARSVDEETDVYYPAPHDEESTGLETRQIGLAFDIASTIIPLAIQADKYVQGIIHKDIERRKQFTQRTIGGLRQKFPNTNFVMCNVGYTFNGDQISKKTVFYHNTIGKKVSFDIIAFGRGTFDRHGDGGFQNWAYAVSSACKTNGGHIEC